MEKDGMPSDASSSMHAAGAEAAINQPSDSSSSVHATVAEVQNNQPSASGHTMGLPCYYYHASGIYANSYMSPAAGPYAMGSDFQSAGLMNVLHPPAGRFSSFANQDPGHFMQPVNYHSSGRVQNNNYRYNSSGRVQNNNYRYNSSGRVQNNNYRYNSRGNNVRNEAIELTRGPRAQNRNDSSSEIEQFRLAIDGEKYNLPQFQTVYVNAKFYVIKSYSEDNVHKSIKYDVWSSTPYGNRKLNAAFGEADTTTREAGVKCPVFLFFSVNGSGQFLGVAEMIGPVDFSKNLVDVWLNNRWNGFFPIKWHIIKDVPNSRLRHIILENNDNSPVICSRDTQEIGLRQGLEMLNIFKSFTGKKSILDDFGFYENPEKLLRRRRRRSAEHRNIDHENDNDVGERIITAESDASSSSLILRTNNLSLA